MPETQLRGMGGGVPGKVGVGPQSDAGGAEFVSLEAEGPEEEDVGWAERAQEGAGGGEGGEAGGVDVGEDGEEDFAGEGEEGERG
jgi:hypothetical protein